MDKSNKKPDVKVVAASDSSLTKPDKKGKRRMEEALEKCASVKKLSRFSVVRPPKKKVEMSNSEDDSASESDEEVIAATIQKPIAAAAQKEPVSSGSSSDSGSDSSLDERMNTAVTKRKPTIPASQERMSSDRSYGSDSDSSSEEDNKSAEAKMKIPAVFSKRKPESSNDSSDSEGSSDEDMRPVIFRNKKKPASVAFLKRPEMSDSSSDSDSDEDDKGTALPKKKSNVSMSKKKSESGGISSESASEEEELRVNIPKRTALPKKKSNVSMSKKKSESGGISSESASEEEELRVNIPKKPAISREGKAAATSKIDSDSNDDSSERSEEEKDAEVKMKDVPTANGNDKQPDAKSDKPITSACQAQPSGPKTVFLGNLSFQVGQDDVADFFKEAKVVNLRLEAADDGSFRGFGHVEFATEAAAKKALEINGQMFLGRPEKPEIAREWGSTPQRGKENALYQKAGQSRNQTIYVNGLDKSLDEYQLGMSSAVQTVCGQAYGAKRYESMGIFCQRALILQSNVSIMLSFFYWNSASFLRLIGQADAIAALGQTYSRALIPQLIAFSLYCPMQRFLQAQNIVNPVAYIAVAVFAFHVLASWIVVFVLKYGLLGAALTLSFSWWILVFAIWLYILLSPSCKETWTGFSVKAFRGLWPYLKLTMASAIMLVLEIWYNNGLVLLTGFLVNPVISLDAISICINYWNWDFQIMLGLSNAASVRVGNELGAAHPRVAKFSVLVVTTASILISLVISALVLILRVPLSKLYTSSEEVIYMVSNLTPLLAISIFLNGVQPILSGVAIGSGWQAIVAYVNVGAYYLIGLPVGCLLGFKTTLAAAGIWWGLIIGVLLQTIALVIITARTNWNKEVEKAFERVNKNAAEDLHAITSIDG